jgi:probable addiction module antidote protein
MSVAAKTFDPAEQIRTEEDARLWLKEFEADGTSGEFASAVGDIARAYGMAQLAKQTGIPADVLFAALNRYPPDMSELAPILEAMGVSVDKPADAAE